MNSKPLRPGGPGACTSGHGGGPDVDKASTTTPAWCSVKVEELGGEGQVLGGGCTNFSTCLACPIWTRVMGSGSGLTVLLALEAQATPVVEEAVPGEADGRPHIAIAPNKADHMPLRCSWPPCASRARGTPALQEELRAHHQVDRRHWCQPPAGRQARGCGERRRHHLPRPATDLTLNSTLNRCLAL